MTDASTQPNPRDAIQAIEYSLSCFSYSLASLIPFIGLPFAFAAFAKYRRARTLSKGQWNPAGRVLLWGSVISSAGLLITCVFVFLFLLWLLQLLPGQYGN